MLKPILFNSPMVRAILEGRKTQTRRLIKNAPVLYEVGDPDRITFGTWLGRYTARFTWNGKAIGFDLPSPYQPGDILYVRETWARGMTFETADKFFYRADGESDNVYKWRPSIHMPKEAARIFLRVTDVRVERLQAISADHCACEGIPLHRGLWRERESHYKKAFANLWDSTVNPSDIDRYGWNADPWVWVYKFEQISKEDAYENI